MGHLGKPLGGLQESQSVPVFRLLKQHVIKISAVNAVRFVRIHREALNDMLAALTNVAVAGNLPARLAYEDAD